MIVNSLAEAQELLESIEQDNYAFIGGSRNDDMCNWFFAKMLVDLFSNERTTTLSNIRDDFFKVMSTCFSFRQIDELRRWDESPSDKLQTLWEYYAEKSASQIMNHLWIDQGGYSKSSERGKISPF